MTAPVPHEMRPECSVAHLLKIDRDCAERAALGPVGESKRSVRRLAHGVRISFQLTWRWLRGHSKSSSADNATSASLRASRERRSHGPDGLPFALVPDFALARQRKEKLAASLFGNLRALSLIGERSFVGYAAVSFVVFRRGQAAAPRGARANSPARARPRIARSIGL
jgi:hypothetical protein